MQTPYQDLDALIKYLKIIKNLIFLEEEETLAEFTKKLSSFPADEKIKAIISSIENKNYASAVSLIETFINEHCQIAPWQDPEVKALRLEIKTLEGQLGNYENEKIELEKLYNTFSQRYSGELGSLILRILALKKLKYKKEEEENTDKEEEETRDKKEKYEKAKQKERAYKEHLEIEKEKKIFKLPADKQELLKKIYREVVHLCHSDKVDKKFEKQANEIFNELQIAYKANDLKKVIEIAEQLKKGNFFTIALDSNRISDKEQLKQYAARLRSKIEKLKQAIITFKEKELYKKIITIEDWDAYFTQQKEDLKAEIETLEEELKATNQEKET